MNSQAPQTYFYLPKVYWEIKEDLVAVLERYSAGEWSFSELWEWHVQSHESLKSDGLFAWIVQPYLYLRSRGVPCELTAEIPSEGIIICAGKFVDRDIKPGKDRVLVVAKGDGPVVRYAQIHLVGNVHEAILQRSSRTWRNKFISHFPHPGLMPRDPVHGDRFQNIAYMGLDTNLAPELRTPEWREKLEKLGFRWKIVSRDRWHDYTDVDAIVAVRSFDSCTYNWKPASKLFNAWLAGTPAILGAESSFQSERKSALDYIEAKSSKEIIDALLTLRGDQTLRQKMVKNGARRSKHIQPEAVVDQWEAFLKKEVYSYYERWTSTSQLKRDLFMRKRDLDLDIRKPIRDKAEEFKGQLKGQVKRALALLK
ncbi:MAG: hypothetical protein AAF685_16220 [Cyanobacteria bacterium P01_C01_bin.89]